MDPLSSAAFASWNFGAPVLLTLIGTLLLYLRGWLAGRRLIHGERDTLRLFAFTSGILAIFVALESPLDSFDSYFLSAHMTQHLLLIMVAPPLLLLGQPMLPLLRGLPKSFVKQGLGPFLAWPALRRVAEFLTSLPVAWLALALSTVLWHLPASYELALSSPAWHGLQHACFFWTGILFWWPVIRQRPGKPRWPQWALVPYLLFSDLVNTALSAFFVFSGTVIYPSYQVIRLSGLKPLDDQALAGAIMWVPGSLIYLLPAFVLASRLLATRPPRPEFIQRQPHRKPHRTILQARHLPQLRRAAQWAMLLVASAILVDGFRGPQIAPLNLAGVLPWIHWRALSVIALLTVGNLFCLSCPFTLVRDLGRKLLPANRRWPHALRNKWIAIVLLVLYLWAYEAFGLWNSPQMTAWIVAGYFAAALAVDGFFKGASFCKYVCPIGQFHFVTSLVTPREVHIRNTATCQSCTTHDCIRGNAQTRGCELDLFQPKKVGNLDCTFCMDCVKACPHDNVTLVQVMPAATVIADPYRSSIGRLSKRTDWAALVLLIVFGAFVNAAGMIEPVMRYEHGWHAQLGVHAMPLIIGLFVLLGAVLLPAAAVLLCGFLNRIAGVGRRALDFARRFTLSLAPMGAAMWAAHLLYHLVTGWNSALPAAARIAGAGTVAVMPYTPEWLTPLQILVLDAGLLLTLYIAWKIALTLAVRVETALALLAPWGALAIALYVSGVWILLQPMQMRGMMMH